MEPHNVDLQDPPLFPAYANALTRWVIATVVGAGATVTAFAWYGYRSDWWQRRNLAPPQPVLFSHEHHTVQLGIDCRFCHSTVEESAFAGMPSTDTCMTCHSGVFTDSPMLAPVVASARDGVPLEWTRVYDLADYVYFDHSIHIAKGVGCTTCHGEIGSQRLTFKAQPLYMSWCLDCHREPEKSLRPRAEIFLPTAPPIPSVTPAARAALARERHVGGKPLTDCTTCHR